MAKHDDEVKVHVTYFGGMYVDPGELLRSTAARETMLQMNRILREERGRKAAWRRVRGELLASSEPRPAP